MVLEILGIKQIIEELYDIFNSQYKEKYYFSFEVLRSSDKNYLILLLPRTVYPYWKNLADEKNYACKDISNEREKFLEELKDNVFCLDLELTYDFVLPLNKDLNFNLSKFITGNNWIYSQIILRPKGQKWIKVLDRYVSSLEKGEDKIKSEGCFYAFISILKPVLNIVAGILTFLFHGDTKAPDQSNKPNPDFVKKIDKIVTYGIKPRNAEQTLALRALLDPDIKLVSLQGVAGTGKTLLALASALEQHNVYNQIILARPIVPLSNKDIGYLPGNAEDKINPYMQPLFDNLKFIKNQFSTTEKKFKKIEEMEETEKLKITALAFIRGRSFSNMLFIVDEAQNLTPHEVKTIITRAGENTKIVFTGDVFQIDTPYLDDQSNGMSYIIDRLKGNNLYAHITLEKGERSELANLANDLL